MITNNQGNAVSVTIVAMLIKIQLSHKNNGHKLFYEGGGYISDLGAPPGLNVPHRFEAGPLAFKASPNIKGDQTHGSAG